MYQKIGSITTNASGYGSYSKYVDASASYYAKETKAPKGYELDETVYTFVNLGKKAADGTKIYSFSCTDEPVDDPVGIVLQKRMQLQAKQQVKVLAVRFSALNTTHRKLIRTMMSKQMKPLLHLTAKTLKGLGIFRPTLTDLLV